MQYCNKDHDNDDVVHDNNVVHTLAEEVQNNVVRTLVEEVQNVVQIQVHDDEARETFLFIYFHLLYI